VTDEEPWLASLAGPAAYPWPVKRVDAISTHISRVFLAGDRAIKLKRPVRFSFVDYSTPALRRQACEDEVRLNRLLSVDVYLGVVPILRDGDGRYRVGEPGDTGAAEWATQMRRLDPAEMLDARLARGAAPAGIAGRLADRLVPFHLERIPHCGGAREAIHAAQAGVLTDNLDDLLPFAGNPLPKAALALLDAAVRQFLDDQRDAMLARIDAGWIREGHGDLRCEHVIVPDDGPVQVYDCVEFSREIRCADIASDLAFLLMDLRRLSAPAGVVEGLLAAYRRAGADLPVGVLRLYWIHRALVRAKVHCLRLADLDGDRRAAVVAKAVDYLHVAMRQAISVRPALIAMTGLSGTGKTTFARSLARATGAEFLDTDVIRKDPAWLGGSLAQARGEDIYTREWTQRTYDRMISTGIAAVGEGRAAILDGTFLDRALRDQAASAARDLGVPFVMVEVRCDDEVAFRRLTGRMADPERISDAGIDVHLRQRERYRANPPGIPAGTVHVVVDTTMEGPASIDPVLVAAIDAGIIVPGIAGSGDL
jgi:hypothetical protein